MLQIEILWEKANLLPESIALETPIPISPSCEQESEENKFSPSTIICLPVLSRATRINEQPQQELNADFLKSEAYENSANPQYNFSSKFTYSHIQQLITDLLLTNCAECKIFLKNCQQEKKRKKGTVDQDAIFGVISMKWREWILSALNSQKSEHFIFKLPILDSQHNTLKKGEIELEIIFYSKLTQKENPNDDEKENVSWQKCKNFMDLIPEKYSYLIINCNDIKSIPNQWLSTIDDDKTQNLISISFEVVCSDNYSEKIEINLPIQTDHISLNEEWMFFIDEYALNYYLCKAQNKEPFDMKFEHMISEQEQKKENTKTIKDTVCLPLNLRPFTRPGTCTLPQTEYAINWSDMAVPSNVGIRFSFKHPLIVPYVKALPSAADLHKRSEIRRNYQQNQNKTQIGSKTKLQAIIAMIQQELKNRYLKVCTTYNNMTKAERKETFLKYLLRSTHGQRLAAILSQIIASVAKEQMYAESELITEQKAMKLRAIIDVACKPVFDTIMDKMKITRKPIKNNDIDNAMKAYLQCTNIDNIYAEPLRNIDSMQTLIEIAFLNQDYQTAHKWIAQTMAVCQDKALYCKLSLDLAVTFSQTQPDAAMAYHCINQSVSMRESKEALSSKVMMLCEEDRLEEAETCMDRLLALFPNDPYVEILKGMLEYLMEEMQDSESILKAQFDIIQQNKESESKEEKQNEYTLYDLWMFAVNIALKFDCKRMVETILTVSRPFFQSNAENKIDFVLLQHRILVYEKKYEIALSKLGEAILINDHETRLWLQIGATYYLSNKLNESMEALQRHMDECGEQQLLPNLMGMLQLIQIYLMLYKQDKTENNEHSQNALSLIEMSWKRIENGQISGDDKLNILVSFGNGDSHFLNALKYKLWTIEAQYFIAVNDATAALANFAHASSLHPFDEKLWKQIGDVCNGFNDNANANVCQQK